MNGKVKDASMSTDVDGFDFHRDKYASILANLSKVDGEKKQGSKPVANQSKISISAQQASLTKAVASSTTSNDFKSELENNKIIRDESVEEFEVSFQDHIVKGYTLSQWEIVQPSNSILSRYTHNPNEYSRFFKVNYHITAETQQISTVLNSWIQSGHMVLDLISSKGVWLSISGVLQESTSKLLKPAILTANSVAELHYGIKHFSSQGYVAKFGGCVNETWILILEKVNYQFEYLFNSGKTADVMKNNLSMTWNRPITSENSVFCYGHKKK